MSYARSALLDLERILEHESQAGASMPALVLRRIADAVSILADHPLVGRTVEEGLRQLVISRGRTGYVALYRFLEGEDVVLILALRQQREAGVGRF